MNRTLLTSAVLLAGTLSAGAADLGYRGAPPPYVPPAFTWSGSYIGINGGFASFRGDTRPVCVGDGASLGDPDCVIVPWRDRSKSGFIGGITSGYNYQLTPGYGLVVGYESDTNFTGLRRRETVFGPFPLVGGGTTGPGAVFTSEEKISYLSTARARVGFAFDRFLIYGTGGLAYGRVRLETIGLVDGILFGARDSGVRAGWVAGGGIEYAFWGNLSAKVEGLVFDIGRRTILGGATGRFVDPLLTGHQIGAHFDTKGAIVRAGLNYKFAWDPITPILSGGR